MGANLNVTNILKDCVEKNASDIFIIAGARLMYKIDGKIAPQSEAPLMPDDTEEIVRQIFACAKDRDQAAFRRDMADDFSFSVPKLGRFRVNTYFQRGSQAAVLRYVRFNLPDYRNLGIPDIVMELAAKKRGLCLVTGPAGTGKSTTLSSIVDRINSTRMEHIVTIEDPIEYLHSHKQSIVSQIEVNSDVPSYVQGLKSSLRQSPNVILLGELRDLDTISIAMTAAETGQLVLSTLHTLGTSNTIDRIVDVFPPSQQQQIRVQLSMVLEAVVTQQLVPRADGRGVVPAFEVLLVNTAIRNMIRDSKIFMIDNVIYASASEGMISMDVSLYNLCADGVISKETAIMHSFNKDVLSKKLGNIE